MYKTFILDSTEAEKSTKPNIKPNIDPNMEPNIEPNIKPTRLFNRTRKHAQFF